MTHHRNKAQRGFTLIEIMVVVLVVGVLASIAVTTYQRNVVESRRKAATACLLEVAQFMERYYTTNLTYAGATVPTLQCRNDLSVFYTIGISGSPTATAYSLTAVPRNAQASRDARCGTLGLTQTGAKSASGAGGVAECW